MTEQREHSEKRRRRSASNSRLRPVAIVSIVAVCALAGVISWFLATANSKGRATVRPAAETVYLDGPFGAPFAGEIVALKKGFFAAEGITLALSAEPRQYDFVAMVAGKSAIGITTGQKFLLARWRGIPVTAFAASFLDTSTAIFALEQSGVRAPKDLVGKRLSYLPGSEDGIIVDALLAKLGLPRSQVRYAPVSDGFAALRRGEIEAFAAPIGQQPLPVGDEALRLNVIRPQQYGLHIPGQVYFASSALIRDRPSIIHHMLRASILGWQATYENPGKTAQMIADYNPAGLTMADIAFALGQQRDLVRPVGVRIADYDASRWNTLRDILLFAKLGKETVGLSTAVSYDFLREVYRRPLELRGGSDYEKGVN